MPEDPNPEDFHGIDKSEANDDEENGEPAEEPESVPVEGQDAQGQEDDDNGMFAGVRETLSGGVNRTKGALAFWYDEPEDDDAAAAAAAEEWEDEKKTYGRKKFLEGAAALAGGALAIDYLSDGDIDGDLEGRGPLGAIGDALSDGDPEGVGTETETPRGTARPSPEGQQGGDTPTGGETPNGGQQGADTPQTDTPQTDTPQTDTPQTDTPTGFDGQIDGRQYSTETIPGPVEGQGYVVDDDLLSQYDSEGWQDIIDEEEYQEMGTGTNWYVTQDAIIAINEQAQISRTFPGQEFNYDTQGLYQDLNED